MPQTGNYIDGQWRPAVSGRTYQKFNPFRPGEFVGTVAMADSPDVDLAVEAASRSLRSWSALTGPQRGAMLFGVADVMERCSLEIATDMSREIGKPFREARTEVARAVGNVRYCAGEGWRAEGEIFGQTATANPIYVLRRPLGVVGLITPWNFPLSIPVWKAAAALAYGNAVVLKVAPDGALTGLHLAACVEKAGLPAGVFNVVAGGGAEAGMPVVAHPGVKGVSFTGSGPVGRLVAERAIQLGKRVQLELGGHNPLVITKTADLARAADAAFAGAYWSAGQKCTATRRIYAEAQIYEDFKALLLRRMNAARIGDPMDPMTEIGPLANPALLSGFLEAVDRACHEGATLLTGGGRLGTEGYVVEPALFEHVSDDSFLSRQEIFGPIASLYEVTSLDEAISRCNDSDFGLSASIFTRDISSARHFVKGVDVGIVRINAATAGGEFHVPFGGTKMSGYGAREQGRAAREFYTQEVTVYEND